MRSISASRSVGGSAPRPSVPAASSSSANSGLPSERENSRDSRSAPGACAEDVVELLGELLARQRLELDAPCAGVALELGQQRAQRVAPVQLVLAVGGDDQHALAAQRAGQVDEEGARGAVGPVQVLDRDQQAGLAREQLEQLQQGVEQARLRGRLVVGALARRRGRGGSAPARRARRPRAPRTTRRRRAPAGAARRRSARRAARSRPARRSRRRSRARRRRAPRARARRAAASCRRRTRRPRTPARAGRPRLRPRAARSSSSSVALPTKRVLVTREAMTLSIAPPAAGTRGAHSGGGGERRGHGQHAAARPALRHRANGAGCALNDA